MFYNPGVKAYIKRFLVCLFLSSKSKNIWTNCIGIMNYYHICLTQNNHRPLLFIFHVHKLKDSVRSLKCLIIFKIVYGRQRKEIIWKYELIKLMY